MKRQTVIVNLAAAGARQVWHETCDHVVWCKETCRIPNCRCALKAITEAKKIQIKTLFVKFGLARFRMAVCAHHVMHSPLQQDHACR